jgi:hypothetical protein
MYDNCVDSQDALDERTPTSDRHDRLPVLGTNYFSG